MKIKIMILTLLAFFATQSMLFACASTTKQVLNVESNADTEETKPDDSTTDDSKDDSTKDDSTTEEEKEK